MSVTYPGSIASPDADDTGHTAWAPSGTLSRIAQRIPTEAAAYEYLEHQRWRGAPACPHCGVVGAHVFLRPANGLSRTTNRGKQSERRVWKCRECKRQFSVITGTVMHGTHVPIRTWVLVSFEVATRNGDLAERDVAKRYGLSAKSAHFLLQRIRDDLARSPDESLFAAIADQRALLSPPPDDLRVPGVPTDATQVDARPATPVGVIAMW